MQQGMWHREKEIIERLAILCPSLDLEPLQAELGTPPSKEVAIAFVGPFNAGKSSIINRLLRRPLLPTRDFTETGAEVRLRKGHSSVATITFEDGRISTQPATSEVLSKAIALLDCHGVRRPSGAIAHEVSIEVDDPTLPSGVLLIDTPGLNDESGMDSRTRTIAAAVDRVVYVLDSRHFLAESDLNHLTLLLSDREADTIHLAVNVFYSGSQRDDWDSFLSKLVPFYRERLSQRLPEIGFGPDHIERLVVVSAEDPVCLSDKGFSDLREALDGIVTEGRRDLLGIHRARVALRLQTLAVRLKSERDALRHELDEIIERQRYHAKLCEANERLMARIQTAGDMLDAFERRVNEKTVEIAESVRSQDFARHASIEASLRSTLKQMLRHEAEAIVMSVAEEANARSSPLIDRIVVLTDLPLEQSAAPIERMALSSLQAAAKAFTSNLTGQRGKTIAKFSDVGVLVGGVISNTVASTTADIKIATVQFQVRIKDAVAHGLQERRRRWPEVEDLLFETFAAELKDPQPSEEVATSLREKLSAIETIDCLLAQSLARLTRRSDLGAI